MTETADEKFLLVRQSDHFVCDIQDFDTSSDILFTYPGILSGGVSTDAGRLHEQRQYGKDTFLHT